MFLYCLIMYWSFKWGTLLNLFNSVLIYLALSRIWTGFWILASQGQVPSVWRWKSILIGYRIVIIDASHSSMPFEEWVLQMRCHHGYYKPYLEFPRIRLVSIYYLLIFIVCVNGFWRFTGEPVSPNVQNYDIFSWFVVVKVILLIAWLPFRVLGLDEGIFIFLL